MRGQLEGAGSVVVRSFRSFHSLRQARLLVGVRAAGLMLYGVSAERTGSDQDRYGLAS